MKTDVNGSVFSLNVYLPHYIPTKTCITRTACLPGKIMGTEDCLLLVCIIDDYPLLSVFLFSFSLPPLFFFSPLICDSYSPIHVFKASIIPLSIYAFSFWWITTVVAFLVSSLLFQVFWTTTHTRFTDPLILWISHGMNGIASSTSRG